MCYGKGCHLSCFSLCSSPASIPFYSVSNVSVSRLLCVLTFFSSQHVPGIIVVLLIRRSAFIGRISGGWCQNLSRLQCLSHLSCWRNGPAIFRATVPVLCGPGRGCFHSQILLNWSEEFHQLLRSNRQTASQWLPLSGRRMDLMPDCLFSGGIG